MNRPFRIFAARQRNGNQPSSLRRPSRNAALRSAFASVALLIALAANGAAGQSPAQPSPPPSNPSNASNPADSSNPRTPSHHLHPRKKTPSQPASAPLALPPQEHPSEPPPPNWPANDQARPASVAWNGRQLTIAAANSSLDEILHEVSSATGLKVDGFDAASGSNDQRIYGSYGPAPARDVLTELLVGSGYNVIMVGDLGAGTPRELLLTAQSRTGQGKTPHANPAAPNESNEEPAEEPEQPEMQRPPPGQPNPGARTPEQMMQELRQRQQQQQMPNNPPQPPPNN